MLFELVAMKPVEGDVSTLVPADGRLAITCAPLVARPTATSTTSSIRIPDEIANAAATKFPPPPPSIIMSTTDMRVSEETGNEAMARVMEHLSESAQEKQTGTGYCKYNLECIRNSNYMIT